MVKINLESIDSYLNSSLEILKKNLTSFFGEIHKLSVHEIKKHLLHFNSYENFEHLEKINKDDLIILDEDNIDIKDSEKLIIDGKFFWEHAAAGEATRLGMGPKYFIDFSRYDIQEILRMINQENESEGREMISLEKLKKKLYCLPNELLPLSFGTRHMLQMIYDVKKLAKKKGIDIKELIKKQKTLIVVNEESSEKILNDFIRNNFFSLDPNNVYFMEQKLFHGITLKEGKLIYDFNSKKRLHNHGQMFMQKLHDDSIFYLEGNNKKFVKSKEYLKMLKEKILMLSYNIEDIGYLTGAIDYKSLALALELSEKGFEMIMEIVKQNPDKPQKGGAAFYDNKLGKICMIESNRLKDLKNEDINHLNKNFNIYINPSNILEKIKENGLPMNIDIKEHEGEAHIYFCPVQGDINFLSNTAFVIRKKPKSIQNLKSPATIPPTINSMFKQDNQPGFKDLVKELIK